MANIKKILESMDKMIKEWSGDDEYGMSPDTIGSYLENLNWHYAGRIEDESIYTYGNSKVTLNDYGWTYTKGDIKKSGSSTKSFFAMTKNKKKQTDEEALLNKPIDSYSFKEYLDAEEKIPNQSPVLGGKPKKQTSKAVGGGCMESKGKKK